MHIVRLGGVLRVGVGRPPVCVRVGEGISMKKLSVEFENQLSHKDLPWIPDHLWQFIRSITVKKPNHRLSVALDRDGSKVLVGINNLIQLASQVTGLNVDELLRKCDFDKNDLDSNRFDALLAELRTINFLDKTGFNQIQPVKAFKNRKSADLLAKRSDQNWAVEVMCSSYLSDRWTREDLICYISRRFTSDGKSQQSC